MGGIAKSAAVAGAAMILFAAGCAHDVRVGFPRVAPGTPTGSVTVRLNHAVTDLTVTVNGALLAEGKHTKKVTVTGVPAGTAEIGIAAGGGAMSRVEKTVRVQVYPYTDTAIAVAAPKTGTGYWVYMGLYQLGLWIYASALYVVLLA